MQIYTCYEQFPPPRLLLVLFMIRALLGTPLGHIDVLKMLLFRPKKLGNESVRIVTKACLLQPTGVDSLAPVAALEPRKIRRLDRPKLPLAPLPASRCLPLQV